MSGPGIGYEKNIHAMHHKQAVMKNRRNLGELFMLSLGPLSIGHDRKKGD